MMAVADDDADRQRFLELLTRDVGRLERLVSGLREVAMVGEQIEQEPTEAVDLAELLRELARRFQMSDGRDVTVALHNPGDDASRPGLTRAARTGVREPGRQRDQFFAERFAGRDRPRRQGPRLRGHRRRSRSWHPEGHLDRIFGRFFTYRPGHRREHHVGLGLAIAKQIVEGYNGVITASNRADGGAHFEVCLPGGDSWVRSRFSKDGPGQLENRDLTPLSGGETLYCIRWLCSWA